MSFRQKFLIYCKENALILTVVPLIISVHWCWSKIQSVPELVPEHKRKELPILAAIKKTYQVIMADDPEKGPDLQSTPNMK